MKRACIKPYTNTDEQNASSPEKSGQAIRPLKINFVRMKQCKFNCLILICFFPGIFSFSHLSAQKLKISCVGNSITYGYGLSNPSTGSYPSLLQELLGGNDWEVRNFGSSGRTVLKAGGYSYWDDPLYKEALSFDPDFVMIELGTNDSKRWLWDYHSFEFKGDYKEMVQSFQNLPYPPEIWIGLLTPGQKTDWDIFNNYIELTLFTIRSRITQIYFL